MPGCLAAPWSAAASPAVCVAGFVFDEEAFVSVPQWFLVVAGFSPKFVRTCFEKYGDFIVPQKIGLNDDGKRNLVGIGVKCAFLAPPTFSP